MSTERLYSNKVGRPIHGMEGKTFRKQILPVD